MNEFSLQQSFLICLTFKYASLIFDSVAACLLQGRSGANRIFYLSVPQEAVLDVASNLSDYAQTQKGWNRVIVEKPFGFDALSSQRSIKAFLSKFEERQLYRLVNNYDTDLILFLKNITQLPMR